MRIDEEAAKAITRRFLGQYHNVIDTKAVLEENTWRVTAQLSFTGSQKKTVQIDAASGKIMGYT